MSHHWQEILFDYDKIVQEEFNNLNLHIVQYLSYNGTFCVVNRVDWACSFQIITLTTKLTNFKYYVPIASLNREIIDFKDIHGFGIEFSDENSRTSADEIAASEQLFEVLKSFKDSHFSKLDVYQTLDFDDEYDETTEDEESIDEEETIDDTDDFDENQQRNICNHFTLEEMDKIIEWVDQHPNQILLSSIYFISNSKLIQNNQELTWTRLIQSYKSMPNAKLKTLRSVFIRSINQQNDFIFHQDSYRENPCLTPSKPAGTIHIIDGNMFGDITSFYKEIFLKIDNLEKSFENYLKTIELIEISNRMKPNENQKTTNNISINIGQNIFIDYSSNKIQSNLFSSNNLKANSYQTNSQNKSTSNVLSSSIQAGANNTVRTTRIQTEDGKFLTTISTISKLTIVMIFKKIFLLKKLKPIFYLVNPIIIQLNEHFLKIQTQIV
ncbi:unnamed protein product [Rotaria magnacalcarata]|uniref:Retinoblastoma-associated protein B-box domain-containing protein n=2 Tax=Rotaria magnacalcarata TaxID=392030 RepID=A0A815ZHC9_9BILA|nr:unnamed protein product [Rotaria magnacalcarata]